MPLYGDQYMQFQDSESCGTEREGHALLERQRFGTKPESLHLGWSFLAPVQTCCLPMDFSPKHKPLANIILSDTSFAPPFLSSFFAGRHIRGETRLSPGIRLLPPASLVKICALTAALSFLISLPVSLLLSDFCSGSSPLSSPSTLPHVLPPHNRGTSFFLRNHLFLITIITAGTGFLISYSWIKVVQMHISWRIGIKYYPKELCICMYHKQQGYENILKSFCFQEHKSFKYNLYGIRMNNWSNGWFRVLK